MDAKDFRLLVALHEDARRSLQALGRQVGLSAPSVRERLKRLESLGILQGFWLSVDPAVFGRDDLLVFFGGDWSRDDATKVLDAPDVAWVAWKLDGGLTVQAWPNDVARALVDLTTLLGRSPTGHAVAARSRGEDLSGIDWRILDALIDAPLVPVKALSESTGLSPKTVRRHLDAMRRSEAVSIVPRLGALTDSGDLVYHLAVVGTVSIAALRRVLGEAVLIHETHTPPLKYLLCRANGLGELAAKTHEVGRLPTVESSRVTLNRELLVGTRFLHRLVRERIDAGKAAPLRRDGGALTLRATMHG